MTERQFVLDEKTLNSILQVLGKLPAEQVFDLILHIKQTVKEYVDPAEGPKLPDKDKKK